MTPDTLMGIIERNARAAELLVRGAQANLAALSEQQLTLEQTILTRLSAIATLHLEQGSVEDAHVSAALLARQSALEQTQRQLMDAEQQVAAALAEKNAVQSCLDGIDQQAREALEQDADYARQVEQLDAVQAAHREQVSGYADLRQECEQKRPTFDVNPIYCYLRSHGYATVQYRRNRLNRSMDSWLATKVNYAANRKNELSLIAMAERNEAMQAEREGLIQTLTPLISTRLEQARETLGLSALLQQLEASQAAIDLAKQRANSIQPQLAAFALNQDPHYLRARQLLTDQLKTRSLGQLIDLASQTLDEADDRLVEQLQGLHLQLQGLEAERSPLQQSQTPLEERYERAKNLQRSLRNEAFTGIDVYFDLPVDFEPLVTQYMDGSVTLGRLVDVLTNARTLVRRSQAANQGFISSTTTSFSFSTTTVNYASNRSDTTGGY